MKILNMLLILSFLVFVVTGCQQQANTTTPVGQAVATPNTPSTVQTQQTATQDTSIDSNITVGDNPDVGSVSAPDVDTSSLN